MFALEIVQDHKQQEAAIMSVQLLQICFGSSIKKMKLLGKIFHLPAAIREEMRPVPFGGHIKGLIWFCISINEKSYTSF